MPVIRISSSLTRVNKWVFPALWFGFLLFFMVGAWRDGAVAREPVVAVAPLAMLVFGFFLFRRMVWDLADTVVDHGGHLVVRRRGIEVTVPLVNIMNISASTLTSPQRLTLQLVEPTALGAEITFAPSSRLTLNPFATRNAVAEVLMERVHAARAAKAAG